MPHGSPITTPPRSIRHTLVSIVAAIVVAGVLPFIGSAERTDNTVRFSSPHRSMIVVGVRVDGKGPYRFLLDTGATSSIVDPQLSASLNLSAAQTVRLASWQDTTDARRVLVQSLSLGPVDSGPLSVLVQPLSEFKAFDSHLRGVLGQDVLLRSNFLIDNRHHRIQFDGDGALLQELTGDHVRIAPVRTRAGALEPRLIAVAVQTARNFEPLHLLLDSGADMVVLQPLVEPPATGPRGTKWIADENGKSSAATTFHTTLAVGSEAFDAEAWIGDTGLKFLAIDGLLPTGNFDQIYIANQGSFVIFNPGRVRHSRAGL
jgi:hypothetical protein